MSGRCAVSATTMSELLPGYVLHSRPYRDTSLIVDLMCRENGRIAAVARGARRGSLKRSPQSVLLQPFRPLLVSFRGKRQLRTLATVEPAGNHLELAGRQLYSGLYVNELVMRLLHADDPHPEIFDAYHQVLQALSTDDEHLELSLRRFEFTLLESLGYGFELTLDGFTGEDIMPQARYRYQEEFGLVKVSPGDGKSADSVFDGADLLALAQGQETPSVRRTAKRLMRQVLASHMQGKPLRSRELFKSQTAESSRD